MARIYLGDYRKCIIVLGGVVLLALLPPAAGAGDKAPRKVAAQGVTIPDVLLQRPKVASERGLYIAAEDALEKMKRSDTILVDVRSAENFQRYRIPGAVHLPLYALKSKPFLKGKCIILVNEGCSYSAMEQECRKLRDSSLEVWILQGGMNYWYGAGYALEGDMIAVRDLSRMSPQDAFNEVIYDRWVVVNIADADAAKVARIFPTSIALPFGRKGTFFAFTAKSRLSSYQDPNHSILIVDENTNHYARVEHTLREAGYKNIFFLEGGRPAYEDVLAKQAMIWRTDAKQTITVKKCKNCS